MSLPLTQSKIDFSAVGAGERMLLPGLPDGGEYASLLPLPLPVFITLLRLQEGLHASGYEPRSILFQ